VGSVTVGSMDITCYLSMETGDWRPDWQLGFSGQWAANSNQFEHVSDLWIR